MRTTIDIDEDILRAARSLAGTSDISLGKALSELARRGLAADRVGAADDGFPLFRASPNAAPITLDDVRRAEDEP